MAQAIPDNIQRTDILVVDPDSAIGEGMQLLFGTAGFVSSAVQNANAAIQAVGALDPRCLVIAAEMSPTSGIDLLITLRNQGVETPAVIIASRGDVPAAVAAIRAGATDFLEKPMLDARLLQTVRRILQKQAAQ